MKRLIFCFALLLVLALPLPTSIHALIDNPDYIIGVPGPRDELYLPFLYSIPEKQIKPTYKNTDYLDLVDYTLAKGDYDTDGSTYIHHLEPIVENSDGKDNTEKKILFQVKFQVKAIANGEKVQYTPILTIKEIVDNGKLRVVTDNILLDSKGMDGHFDLKWIRVTKSENFILINQNIQEKLPLPEDLEKANQYIERIINIYKNRILEWKISGI
jgi:hypothetical protein